MFRSVRHTEVSPFLNGTSWDFDFKHTNRQLAFAPLNHILRSKTMRQRECH